MQAGTRFTYPKGMEGWVHLGVGYIPRWFTCPQIVTRPSSNHLIATQPGVEPTTSRSQVQRFNRYTTRPPSVGWHWLFTYLPTVTHPSTNWAWHIVTWLIERNALTTTPRSHDACAVLQVVNVWCRYSELRLMNQKMTRQLGEKDEQLQEIRQKVDSVSLDLRKSDKAKREVIFALLLSYRELE